MAKSLRSKRKRKLRAVKREKNKVKEADRLKKILGIPDKKGDDVNMVEGETRIEDKPELEQEQGDLSWLFVFSPRKTVILAIGLTRERAESPQHNTRPWLQHLQKKSAGLWNTIIMARLALDFRNDLNDSLNKQP